MVVICSAFLCNLCRLHIFNKLWKKTLLRPYTLEFLCGNVKFLISAHFLMNSIEEMFFIFKLAEYFHTNDAPGRNLETSTILFMVFSKFNKSKLSLYFSLPKIFRLFIRQDCLVTSLELELSFEVDSTHHIASSKIDVSNGLCDSLKIYPILLLKMINFNALHLSWMNIITGILIISCRCWNSMESNKRWNWMIPNPYIILVLWDSTWMFMWCAA